MLRPLPAALLIAFALLGAPTAQAHTAGQIQAIEDAYSTLYPGHRIPDAQLNYYLDRSDAGWTMDEISNDIRTTSADPNWHPGPTWKASDVICTSIDNKYKECSLPANTRAQLSDQMSEASCVSGQDWGQKGSVVWVSNGCRARFSLTAMTPPAPVDHDHGGYDHSGTPGASPPERVVVCQSRKGRYRTCPTGSTSPVRLLRRLPGSRTCAVGRSWGQQPGLVWVSRGCRAQFAAAARPDNAGNPADNPNGTPRPAAYVVLCESVGNRQTTCAWDGRQGRPHLLQQVSQASCDEGSSWGYDEHDGLWVSEGCRARFGR